MIVVVDYNAGNLRSVLKALESLGASVQIGRTASDIQEADALIVPGQGAFKSGLQHLEEQGLVDPILSHINGNKPFLGICLGFQFLFNRSLEHGDHPGWGLFDGDVVPFEPPLPVPHMGWNPLDVTPQGASWIPQSDHSPHMYFVHSYCVKTTTHADVSAWCTYGEPFVAAVQKGSVFGTQFHPEKSGAEGLAILKRFLEISDG